MAGANSKMGGKKTVEETKKDLREESRNFRIRTFHCQRDHLGSSFVLYIRKMGTDNGPKSQKWFPLIERTDEAFCPQEGTPCTTPATINTQV